MRIKWQFSQLKLKDSTVFLRLGLQTLSNGNPNIELSRIRSTVTQFMKNRINNLMIGLANNSGFWKTSR
jgi:hypothetical protein